jgi:hypothetical protein
MPFQSEKQRRYLWANEPEIARDWTDTYGSGIAKALGGRIGFGNGSGNIRQQPHQPRDLLVQNNPYGTRPRYQPPGGGATSLGSGRDAPGSDRGPRDAPDRHGPVQTVTPTRSRIQDERQQDFRQKQIREDIARREAEKDYTRTGQIKPGPQLGLTRSGVGGGLGNWASQFAGSKIGGGLGSMLFGPWGALLGALFGRGVGKRGYQAYQTPKEETWKDIAFGENTLLSNLLNKEKTPTPTGEGLGGLANARRLMTQPSQIPGANPLWTTQKSDPYQQNFLMDPTTVFKTGMYESPKRSAKDFIDFDKSYSEFDTIPNPKYHGLNVERNYLGEGIGPDFKLAHHKFDPNLDINLTGKERNETRYLKRTIQEGRKRLEQDDEIGMMDEKSRKFNEQQLLDNEQKLRNMLGIEREA